MSLFQKFRVERSDGRQSEKDLAARYYVLNYVGDRHARVALRAYAESINDDDPELSLDLLSALEESRSDYQKFGLHHVCKED